jgi:hypothetical protein
MNTPKFLVGMELTGIVQMHEPSFKANVVKIAELLFADVAHSGIRKRPGKGRGR